MKGGIRIFMAAVAIVIALALIGKPDERDIVFAEGTEGAALRRKILPAPRCDDQYGRHGHHAK